MWSLILGLVVPPVCTAKPAREKLRCLCVDVERAGRWLLRDLYRGVEKEAAPGSFARGRPDPIPVIILARLAVDAGAQGKGVGRALLRDALARCFTAAAAVGAAAVVVHALDQSAKDFYLRHADFREMPGEPLHLLLPMKGIAQIVGQ